MKKTPGWRFFMGSGTRSRSEVSRNRRPVHENMYNTALHYSKFICILPIFRLTFDTKRDTIKMPSEAI